MDELNQDELQALMELGTACTQVQTREQLTRLLQRLGGLLPHLRQAAESPGERGREAGPVRLSSRQREVLRWLREGKTTWEISRILGIAERTVKFHVANLCLRLNANNRLHVLARAQQLDLLH